MQVMVRSDEGPQPYNEAKTVYLIDKNNIVINQGSGEEKIQGEIVDVSHADIISISDYYGSGVAEIDGSDIHAIDQNAVSLYCDEAMQVANRVDVKLKSGKSVELNGTIVGCEVN